MAADILSPKPTPVRFSWSHKQGMWTKVTRGKIAEAAAQEGIRLEWSNIEAKHRFVSGRRFRSCRLARDEVF